MSIVWYFAALVVLIALSAFFSASEMSYSSANRLRLENAAEDGDRRAKTAVGILDHFDRTLSAILIGNNLVNIAASSLGSVIVILLAGEQWTWVSTVVLTLLVIIFGETMPKIVAKQNANGIALRNAYIIRALSVILYPVIWLVVGLVHLITRPLHGDAGDGDPEEAASQELQSIIETAEDEDVLDEDRSELLRSALDFSDVADSEYAQEIDSLAASRIVFGDGGKFRPDATMTRAEVCALLAQALDLYSTANGYFTDVVKGSWYAPSVNAMAAIGLVSGVGGGKFDPNATMTQEEFITVLGRLVEFVNLDAREFLDKNPLAILQPLPKYKSFSHWAIRSAELLTNSVFDENGDAVNMYCMSLEDIEPQVPILREQAAAALYNALRTTGVLKY